MLQAEQLLTALCQADVAFVIIGGMAAVAHGSWISATSGIHTTTTGSARRSDLSSPDCAVRLPISPLYWMPRRRSLAP